MSIKNKSKRPSTKASSSDESRRKVVKGRPTKEDFDVEGEEESRETVKATSAPTSAPVQKPANPSVAKKKVEEAPWSEWTWDEGSGQWYRARQRPDKTWQYDYPEPPEPVLLPGPVPQFAPAEKFEYCEPGAKVIFANEVVYQVEDSRGGYQLAVRQDRCIWNVENTPNPTKAKEVPKKVDSGTETKESGGGGETKATAQDAGGQYLSAGQKVPTKAGAGSEEKLAAGDSGSKKIKEENGSAPESSKKQSHEIEKKSKHFSKPRKKVAYIESDEEDEPRHRGRPRERRR